MRKLFFLCALACGISANAQQRFMDDLRRNVDGQGEIVVHQSSKLDALVNGTASTKTPDGKAGTSTSSPSHTSTQPTTSHTNGENVKGAAETSTSHKTYRNRSKSQGYRIQVFAGGNSRESRREAERMAALTKQNFPGLPVYTHFYNPRWICRAGDFRSYEEASSILHQMRTMGGFSEASIIKCEIQIGY